MNFPRHCTQPGNARCLRLHQGGQPWLALKLVPFVFEIEPSTGERLGLLATATMGEGGWVDLSEPMIVNAGEALVALPEV